MLKNFSLDVNLLISCIFDENKQFKKNSSENKVNFEQKCYVVFVHKLHI